MFATLTCWEVHVLSAGPGTKPFSFGVSGAAGRRTAQGAARAEEAEPISGAKPPFGARGRAGLEVAKFAPPSFGRQSATPTTNGASRGRWSSRGLSGSPLAQS